MADPLDDIINKALSGTPTRTPASKATPTATPLAGSLNTDTELMIGLKSGQITYEQVAERYGTAKADQLMAKVPSKSQQATIDRIKAEIAQGAAPQQTISPSTNDGAPVGTDWEAVAQAYDTGSPMANFGSVSNAGTSSAGQTAASGGGSRYTGGSSAGTTTARAVQAAKASTAQAEAPPAPGMNTALDLQARGAIPVGRGIAVLNGQQYMKLPQEAMQASDNLWYLVDPNNPTAPLGKGYRTQAEANANAVYTPVGVAVTADNPANSPLARAASRGGNVPRVENPLFATNTMDEMIAAGAQRGTQPGDIATTVRPFGGRNAPLEVTEGGIPEYGGLQPVEDAMGNFQSYTGQVPGNVSVGASSPVTGNMSQDLYWLQQAMQIPINDRSTMNKLANLSPEQMRQMHEQVADMRAAGTYQDPTQIAFRSEPSLSPLLDWTTNPSDTEYDRYVDTLFDQYNDPNLEFLPEYMDPEMLDQMGMGDPMANRRGMYDYDGSLLTFAQGGDMVLDEPAVLTGLRSKRPLALMGEAGEQERVSMGNGRMDIQPMGRPQSGGLRPDGVRLGREMPMQSGGVPAGWIPPGLGRMPGRFGQTPQPGILPGEQGPPLRPDFSNRPPLLAGLRAQFPSAFEQMNLPQSVGGLRLFATGGTVYSGYGGINKGFTSVTENPYSGIQGDNPMTPADRDLVQFPGTTGHQYTYVSIPPINKQGTVTPSGMRTPGADDLSAEQENQFIGGQSPLQRRRHQIAMQTAGRTIGAQPVGYTPYGAHVLPTYEGANQGSLAQLYASGSDKVREVLTPTIIGGQPALVKTYRLIGSGGGYGPASQAVLRGLAGTIFGGLFGGMEDEGGQRIDPLREATDRRDYGIQARNYAAAGMDPPAILDLLETDDEGNPYYRNFSGTIPNGMRLPFGYDPTKTGPGNTGSGGLLEDIMRRGGWRPQLGSGLG